MLLLLLVVLPPGVVSASEHGGEGESRWWRGKEMKTGEGQSSEISRARRARKLKRERGKARRRVEEDPVRLEREREKRRGRRGGSGWRRHFFEAESWLFLSRQAGDEVDLNDDSPSSAEHVCHPPFSNEQHPLWIYRYSATSS